MKFLRVYVPEETPLARAVRWLGRNTEIGLSNIETLWTKIKTDSVTATISTGYSVAALTVPKPPAGYKILVEAWVAASWPSGSPVDAVAQIEVGNQAIAAMTMKDVNSAGSMCPNLVSVFTPTQDTTFRLQVDYTADRTTLDLRSRGIRARYVKEG